MKSEKIALVTGAGQGIGFEVVRELAARRFQVFLTARRADAGRAAAEKIRAAGGDVRFIALDVADEKSVRRAAGEFGAAAGVLDVLVNNAGVVPDGNDGSILTVPPAAYEKAFRTNALGPLLVTRAFLPFLKKSRDARVINVSSGAGSLSEPGSWAPAYSTSKTALNAVTAHLALALKSGGISVNAVCPGWVRTEMGGPNATRSVEEGADTILWLAAEAPASLTGRIFRDRKPIPW